MLSVGAYEAKTHLSELLGRVARGERITITKHGHPVAMLVPPPDAVRHDPREVIQAIGRLRKGCRLGGLSVRKMREAGRK